MEATTYTYDDNDRLLIEQGPQGVTTYSWDDNGNMVSRSGPEGLTTYTWDDENRLVDVQTPTHTLEFGYDDDGIRFYKVVDGTRTDFLIDPNQTFQQVLQERDPITGTPLAQYTYGHDLLSQHNPTYGPAYYHYDAQLSTRFLTDTAANIVNTYEYSAFGPFLTQNALLPNPFTYTGEYFDAETSLLYLRARYLNMDESRFLSEDPVERIPERPMDFHAYAYARNNPLNNIDFGGTYIEPSSLSFGRAIHLEIYKDFKKEMENKRTIGETDRSIKWILIKCGLIDRWDVGGPGVIGTIPAFLIRPDLAACGPYFQVDEIKSVYSAPIALIEVMAYVFSLNYYTRQPGVVWIPGIIYIPESYYTIGVWYAYVWREAPGIILYVRSRRPIPVPVPLTERAKDRLRKLQERLKYSFEQFAPVALASAISAATGYVIYQYLSSITINVVFAF